MSERSNVSTVMRTQVLADALRMRWRTHPDALLYPTLLVALVTCFYHVWLLQTGLVTAGDESFYTMARLREDFPFPALWDATLLTGGYQTVPMFMPLLFLQGLLASIGLDWALVERLMWLVPAIVVPCVSTYALALALFRDHRAAFISAIAVVMNSYAYLIYQGGQLGVAVGYGCMPLVLWAFVRGQRRGTLRSFVLTGLLMAVQAMYDLRSTYITVGVLLLYGIICGDDGAARRPANWLHAVAHSSGVPQTVVALVVMAIIHLWWILPAIFAHGPSLPAGYGDVAAVQPLSYMHVSNALSLFHPLWNSPNLRLSPINPLFFAAPLLIFRLARRKQADRRVLFLAAVALVAAFFVKGDNDPAGHVYDWLFVHLPGFSLFRDPSKFYQPLALAFALLLGVAALEWWPQSVSRSIEYLGRLFRESAPEWRHRLRLVLRARRTILMVCAPLLFVVLAAFPAYPALLPQADSTFSINPLPADYAQLNSLIDRQQGFFRVLWVPARPRFGTSSALHPGLDAAQLSACCVKAAPSLAHPWSWLGLPEALQLLRALSIRYVVVPDQTKSADFSSVSYSPKSLDAAPTAVLAAVRAFLPRLHEFQIGHLHVFVDPGAYPLLYATPGTRSVHTPSRCTAGPAGFVELCSDRGVRTAPATGRSAVLSYNGGGTWSDVWIRVTQGPAYLVFQQTYDPEWLAFIQPDGQGLFPWTTLFEPPVPPRDHVVANGYANAWLIRKPGTYHIVVEYWPQRLALVGWIVALAAIAAYGSLLLVQRRRSSHAGAPVLRAGHARLMSHNGSRTAGPDEQSQAAVTHDGGFERAGYRRRYSIEKGEEVK